MCAARPPQLGRPVDPSLGRRTRTRTRYTLGITLPLTLPLTRYTLGITPLPKGSLGLASAPKFRPMPPSTVVATSADGSQKQWPVNHFFDEEGTFAEESFINVRPSPSPTPSPSPSPSRPTRTSRRSY